MATRVAYPPMVEFIGGFVVTALLFPLIILGAGGDWRWTEGWLVALWFDVMVLANMTYLYFKDPALLAERRKRPGSDNQKGWDAVMLRGIYALALAWLVILPLDASRFHWSPPFPLGPRSPAACCCCPLCISSSARPWKTPTCRRWSASRTIAATG